VLQLPTVLGYYGAGHPGVNDPKVRRLNRREIVRW